MNHKSENTYVAETTSADPMSIHQRAIAIDMHVDTAQRLLDEDVDIQQQLSDGHFDAVRAKAGGLDAQFFSIWVEPQLFGGGGERAVKRADDQIHADRSADRNPRLRQRGRAGMGWQSVFLRVERRVSVAADADAGRRPARDRGHHRNPAGRWPGSR